MLQASSSSFHFLSDTVSKFWAILTSLEWVISSMVEQLTLNQLVAGSSPAWPSFLELFFIHQSKSASVKPAAFIIDFNVPMRRSRLAWMGIIAVRSPFLYLKWLPSTSTSFQPKCSKIFASFLPEICFKALVLGFCPLDEIREEV